LPIVSIFSKLEFYIMGKQYNKILKRRRRAAYLAKRKAALKELVSKSVKSTKTKATKPRAVRKTAAAKKEKVEEPKPEPVADKANPTDILGSEDAKQTAPKESKEKEELPQEESKDSAES
jgi:hypothetical protein